MRSGGQRPFLGGLHERGTGVPLRLAEPRQTAGWTLPWLRVEDERRWDASVSL